MHRKLHGFRDHLNLCRFTSDRFRIPCILAESTAEMIQGTGCRQEQAGRVSFVTTPYAHKWVQMMNKASVTRTNCTRARRCLYMCPHIYYIHTHTCAGKQTTAHITINSRVRLVRQGCLISMSKAGCSLAKSHKRLFQTSSSEKSAPSSAPRFWRKEIRRPIYCQTLSGTANTTEPSD